VADEPSTAAPEQTRSPDAATPAPSEASQTGTGRRLWPYAGAVLVVVALVTAGWYVHWRSRPPTVAEVERLLRRQQIEEAEQAARALVAADPENPQKVYLLARTLAAADKLVEAAELLEELEVDGPRRAEALLRAGQCWLRAHYRRKAEAAFYRCLEVEADEALTLPEIHQAARRELAGIYATERRTGDFRRITWSIYEESAPHDKSAALASRIRYDFEMVDPRVAIASLEPAIQADPSDVYSRRAIGFYYLELGDAAKARPYLIRCVQDAPKNPIMWETWLHCLVRVADTILAERYLEQVPPEADSLPLCWRYRAQLLDLLGRTEEAVAAAQRAVQLAPFDPENQYQLAQMLIRANRRQEAEQHIRRSQELQDLVQELRDAFERFRREWQQLPEPQQRCDLAVEIAQICEKLGRIRDAYGWYGVALHEVPNHAPAIEARNRLEERLLDPDLPY